MVVMMQGGEDGSHDVRGEDGSHDVRWGGW